MSDNANAQPPTTSPEVDAPQGETPTRSPLLGWIGFAIALAATVALGYFAGQWGQNYFAEPVSPKDDNRYEVRLRGDEPQRGPDDALVTIVEFSDFECPYCARATGPLEDAMEGFEGDVRLVFKHFPLPGHRNALPAARTAWAAQQQGKFWEAHDWLFEQRGSIDELPSFTEDAGLDPDRLGRDMQSEASSEAVDDDRIAGGSVGIRGTPGFVVNGHIYGGLLTEGQWTKIIEAELDAARDLVDGGTARTDVYGALMKDALKKRGPGPLPSVGRRPGEPDPNEHYRVEAGEGRPARGGAEPLVTIVEFADFHCPFCAKASKTIQRVVKAFPEEDVRLVYRHHPLPMHRRARAAAVASLAAHRQGKFWEMHDAIFDRQAKSDEDLADVAQGLGLDMTRFEADLADPALNAMVDEDMALAKRFGAQGTPAFFINGRFLAGARSAPEIRSIVEQELERARAQVEAGTPRGDVFAKLMAAAKTEVAK